jgi:hypothetical protein
LFPITCCRAQQSRDLNIVLWVIYYSPGNYSQKPKFLSIGADPILC